MQSKTNLNRILDARLSKRCLTTGLTAVRTATTTTKITDAVNHSVQVVVGPAHGQTATKALMLFFFLPSPQYNFTSRST